MIVNEVLACELPVISSNHVVVTRDLVKDGINGYSFDPHNIGELTQRLKELILDDKERIKMGKKSSEIIRDKTPQKYAESILKVIKSARQ